MVVTLGLNVQCKRNAKVDSKLGSTCRLRARTSCTGYAKWWQQVQLPQYNQGLTTESEIRFLKCL